MTNITSKHANYDELLPFPLPVCVVLRGRGTEASSLQVYCLCSKTFTQSLPKHQEA